MENEFKKFLADVLISLDYIGREKLFNDYQDNPLLQDAVERNLITIGEAINSLLKLKPDIEISNARRIVDARNKLTHGYHAIDNVMV